MKRTPPSRTSEQLRRENAELRTRLEEAEETLRTIRIQNEAAAFSQASGAREAELDERQRTEEKAKAERQRLYDVLEALPAYVILINRDYRVSFANRFFRERFGESHRQYCFEYLFNRTTVCELCETFSVFRTGVPRHWEWIGPDGRNYDVHAFPFTDTDGSTLILEMGIDITDRKRAEAELSQHHEHLEQTILDRTAALAASEQRYRELFESMTNGFAACEIITDERGQPCDYRFLEANPAFERLTGLVPADLIGKRVLEVLPGTEPYWIATFGRVALTGEPVDFERFFPPLNRWYEVFSYRTRPGQFAIIFSDVTARKQTEEALRDLNETLERRVTERTAEVQDQALRLRALAAELGQSEQRERKRIAQVLHDHVQQLLAAARMELEVLTREAAADETAEKALRAASILSDAMRALRSLTVELSPPILHEAGLVAGLRWLALRMSEQHEFQVNVRGGARVEPIVEDLRLLLFECVRELLLNALKHSGVRKADVTVTRTPDDRIKITVEDSGLGFAPGGLWTSTHGRGTFGLFSVQERLAHFWGSMRIESAPGQGTRVELLAPLLETEPTGTHPAATLTGGPTPASTRGPSDAGSKIRVLVVDDHHIARDGMTKILQSEQDIEVVGEAVDAPQAVELARTLDPDVVIMDVSLGATSGIDATRDIRRSHPRICVIGLTMHEDQQVGGAMRDAGAAACLSKAGRVEDLIAAIHACMRRRRESGSGRPVA